MVSPVSVVDSSAAFVDPPPEPVRFPVVLGSADIVAEIEATPSSAAVVLVGTVLVVPSEVETVAVVLLAGKECPSLVIVPSVGLQPNPAVRAETSAYLVGVIQSLRGDDSRGEAASSPALVFPSLLELERQAGVEGLGLGEGRLGLLAPAELAERLDLIGCGDMGLLMAWELSPMFSDVL
jgi:hypothetical protein